MVYRSVLAAILAVIILGTAVRAQVFSAGHCHTAIPESELTGFTPLPQGEIFCSLIADPKSVHSFVSMLDGTSENFPSQIGAVGIGDSFGIFRWDKFQLGLAGSVFSQFDLEASSYDLINSDYIISIPLTFRYRGFSGRFRVYHQSSHLGDEFLLRAQPERENLSFESIETLLSQELGILRLYAGGERLIHPTPEDLGRWLAHGGGELRPGFPLVRIHPLGSIRLLGAVDVKSTEEQDWDLAASVRVGVEGSRPEMPESPIDRWRLLIEYYEGPTPYGQFFRSDMSYWGIGLHFSR
jgi:hypothetical protein